MTARLLHEYAGAVVIHDGEPYYLRGQRVTPGEVTATLRPIRSTVDLNARQVLCRDDVRRLLTDGMCARCGALWPDHTPGTDDRRYCATCCPDCKETTP